MTSINDNTDDIIIEILSRLDGRSLATSASVCKRWNALCRKDAVWEALCNRHVPGGGPGTKAVVSALGGYRRMYRVCVGPVLERMGRAGRSKMREEDPVRLSMSLSLSLSLFSIDCYERIGGRQRSDSLLFLNSAVDVV